MSEPKTTYTVTNPDDLDAYCTVLEFEGEEMYVPNECDCPEDMTFGRDLGGYIETAFSWGYRAGQKDATSE